MVITFKFYLQVIVEFFEGIKTGSIVRNDVLFVPVATGVLVEVLAGICGTVHGLQKLGGCKKGIGCQNNYKANDRLIEHQNKNCCPRQKLNRNHNMLLKASLYPCTIKKNTVDDTKLR